MDLCQARGIPLAYIFLGYTPPGLDQPRRGGLEQIHTLIQQALEEDGVNVFASRPGGDDGATAILKAVRWLAKATISTVRIQA